MQHSAETKSSSNSNSPSSTVFFNKSGEESFFSSPKTERPFFSPKTIQTKLTIGAPDDEYEQEADALADRVVRGEPVSVDKVPRVPTLQSMCANCAEKDENLQRVAAPEQPAVGIHTKPALMQKTIDGNSTGTSALQSQLNSTKGGGQNLPEDTNEHLSQSFGTDFSHIRIHTDANAIEMNQGLNARAFTHGSDIYFNHGEYNPGSSEGEKLVAHELVHTIQQGHLGKNVQKKQSFRQQIVGGNHTGLSEEEFVRSQVDDHHIQRSVNWAAGAVHETINSAEQALWGTPNPTTWEMLNGTMLKTHALASGAIKSPSISAYKAGASWKAKVTVVPLNEGSFDETVYAPGPWTAVAPKATVNAAFGEAACTGAGNTTFQSKGQPNDAAIYKANRRHEDHHANDHHAAFNAIVKTWDTKVTKAKDNGTEYNGASSADAEANLWAAMGGTPAQIAIQFNDECASRGAAFHGTAKGGPMTVAGTGSDKTCTNSWVFVKNPS